MRSESKASPGRIKGVRHGAKAFDAQLDHQFEGGDDNDGLKGSIKVKLTNQEQEKAIDNLYNDFHKAMFCPNLYPYIEKDYGKEWNKRTCSNVKTCDNIDTVFTDDDKFFENSNGCHVLCPKCVKDKKK